MTDILSVNATCRELSTLDSPLSAWKYFLLSIEQKNVKTAADRFSIIAFAADSLCTFYACKVSSTSGSSCVWRFLAAANVPRNSVFQSLIARYPWVALKESTSFASAIAFELHESFLYFVSRFFFFSLLLNSFAALRRWRSLLEVDQHW